MIVVVLVVAAKKKIGKTFGEKEMKLEKESARLFVVVRNIGGKIWIAGVSERDEVLSVSAARNFALDRLGWF